MQKARFVIAMAAGALVALGMTHWLAARSARPPPSPVVLTQVREVARLETLDITLYKKITFEPEPVQGESLWQDVANWARYSMKKPRGKAIIFGEAHIGLSLEKLGLDNIRVARDEVYLVLPEIQVRVELKPGETEIIDSNLDSTQTAQLFDLAKSAFERELMNDGAIRTKARDSAQRALRGLLVTLGFRKVHFVEMLPQSSET